MTIYVSLGQQNNALSIAKFAKRRYNNIKTQEEGFMNTQLSQKEQEIIVLGIVDACIQYSKEHNEDFEEVLHQHVFANEADLGFMEMVCKTIESLHKQGYIAGTVDLVYEDDTDDIDFFMTTFENISINTRGRVLLGAETFKELGKNFMEKAKPVIKSVSSVVLQTAIETAFTTGLKAVGVPV